MLLFTFSGKAHQDVSATAPVGAQGGNRSFPKQAASTEIEQEHQKSSNIHAIYYDAVIVEAADVCSRCMMAASSQDRSRVSMLKVPAGAPL